MRNHLHIEVVTLWKQWPNGAVNQARNENFFVTRFAFALKEAARDTPGGEHFLLVFNSEREKIDAFTRLFRNTGGDEHHRIASLHTHGTPGLFGQLARFKVVRHAANGDGFTKDLRG